MSILKRIYEQDVAALKIELGEMWPDWEAKIAEATNDDIFKSMHLFSAEIMAEQPGSAVIDVNMSLISWMALELIRRNDPRIRQLCDSLDILLHGQLEN